MELEGVVLGVVVAVGLPRALDADERLVVGADVDGHHAAVGRVEGVEVGDVPRLHLGRGQRGAQVALAVDAVVLVEVLGDGDGVDRTVVVHDGLVVGALVGAGLAEEGEVAEVLPVLVRDSLGLGPVRLVVLKGADPPV